MSTTTTHSNPGRINSNLGSIKHLIHTRLDPRDGISAITIAQAYSEHLLGSSWHAGGDIFTTTQGRLLAEAGAAVAHEADLHSAYQADEDALELALSTYQGRREYINTAVRLHLWNLIAFVERSEHVLEQTDLELAESMASILITEAHAQGTLKHWPAR